MTLEFLVVPNTVKRVGIETYIKLLKKHKIESNEENPVDADNRMETEEIEEDKPTIEQHDVPAEQRTAVSSTIPEQATALNSSFDLLVSNLSGMNISGNSSIGSPSPIFGTTSYGSHSFSSPCGFGSPPTRTRPSYPIHNCLFPPLQLLLQTSFSKDRKIVFPSLMRPTDPGTLRLKKGHRDLIFHSPMIELV
ncbi:unnamed protein product [Cylindrotheca closterium]|uniref:Uncharacterized protein n=1 Tax=Cylindrotheca closterium TaxID=2856 RepID=A0AAD2FML9_9STRA|nr:unnamed protein product [Cylindrotheca closterium]